MKTFLKLLFFVACVTLLASCEKEEDFFFEEDNAELKGAKIKVTPCSSTDVFTKAETDWYNINEALQNAKSGEVVQLGAGTFYLHKSIVRWDFNGTLKGAGKEKTIIRTAPGMLFNVEDCPPLNWSFEENDGFFMFCFNHHENSEKRTVTVSDLKIIVDEPTTPYYRLGGTEEGNALQALNVQYENLDNDLDNPIHLNVVYKNLAIIGEYDPGTYLNSGYSLFAGLVGFGSSSGNFVANNVYVENAGVGILPHAFNGEKSVVILKNSVVDNTSNGIYSIFNRCWMVSNNDFKNSFASVVLNKYRDGMDVDLPSGRSFIMNNKINVTNGVAFAGYDMENTQIKNNICYGSGFTGIWVMRGNNWSIKDNDLCEIVMTEFITTTIFLINPTDFEVKNNINQSVSGPGSDDPSVIIKDGLECD